jgi:hypothetical protein
MCGKMLDLLSDVGYNVVANIEAFFAGCVVHVIRTCHTLFTSGGEGRSDGRTLQPAFTLGAIPVGPAVCV